MSVSQFIVVAILIAAGVATPLVPFLHYVAAGWKAKRQDIMDGLSEDARIAYVKMFTRDESLAQPSTPADGPSPFLAFYSKWYGRRFFVAPGILLTLVTLCAVTAVAMTALHQVQYIAQNPLFDVPAAAVAATAGAYMWVANDLISRTRRRDLAPSDVMWGVLRLVIAVPMGYAFASVAAESVGPFVAFALGAFPLTALTSLLQRQANKQLGTEPKGDEASDDIVKVQGVNRAIVERLASEDITTVTQMAYCDPVRVVMRTNLTFNFVIDCMNQSLARLYLGDDLEKLRPLGLRGAAEIKHLIDAIDDDASSDPEAKAEHERAVAALPKIAAVIKQDLETAQLAFREIAEDPYTIFLENVWT